MTEGVWSTSPDRTDGLFHAICFRPIVSLVPIEIRAEPLGGNPFDEETLWEYGTADCKRRRSKRIDDDAEVRMMVKRE